MCQTSSERTRPIVRLSADKGTNGQTPGAYVPDCRYSLEGCPKKVSHYQMIIKACQWD